MNNLPSAFTQRMHRLLQTETDRFLDVLQKAAPVSIRFNTAKLAPASVRSVSYTHLTLPTKLEV